MTYTAPLNQMRFVLNDVFEASKQWASLPAFAAIDNATVDAILEEGSQLCTNVVAPLNRSGDEEEARLENGVVITPHGFKAAYSQLAKGGWVGLAGDTDYGGQGLPKMLTVLFEEMLYSANNSFTLYVALTAGAALALRAHGSEALKKKYLPNLYSGKWAGAMGLTEAHCGSDLGLLKTKAIPDINGTCKITGTKIFITGGDQDLTENIIHFVLARLPDAPSGSKGISLFLVPKVLVNDDGSLGAHNAVNVGALEHKMGIKASATCVMNFDGATAWLVGEPQQGLAAMFTMMNYERLSIGIQGIGCGEMSYQNAVRYAKERLQGRAAHAVIKANAADPIIQHADIRRMLLTQRAYNEAGRAFAVYLGLQLDIANHHAENRCRDQAAQRVALLTPVAKAFFTDKGFEACVLGQQVLGGHGYIRENEQEQLVRDARIAQIYEGTNGIQAQDLLKRKVLANRGAWLESFLAEIRNDIAALPVVFADEVRAAHEACERLASLTQWLIAQDAKDPDASGAAACDYLHLTGYTAYAWLWLKMMAKKPECSELQQVGHFYFGRLLPNTLALDAAIRSGSQHVMALAAEQF